MFFDNLTLAQKLTGQIGQIDKLDLAVPLGAAKNAEENTFGLNAVSLGAKIDDDLLAIDVVGGSLKRN